LRYHGCAEPAQEARAVQEGASMNRKSIANIAIGVGLAAALLSQVALASLERQIAIHYPSQPDTQHGYTFAARNGRANPVYYVPADIHYLEALYRFAFISSVAVGFIGVALRMRADKDN
jgi:hypothetical protein